MYKVSQLITGDVTIHGDLHQPFLLPLHGIQGCNGFRNDIGQIIELEKRDPPPDTARYDPRADVYSVQ